MDIYRVARSVVRRYPLPTTLSLEDLVQEGYIAHSLFIQRYQDDPNHDPERTTLDQRSFLRVRGAMIDLIRSQDWVPRKERQKVRLDPTFSVPALVSLDHYYEDPDTPFDPPAPPLTPPDPSLILRPQLRALLETLPPRLYLVVTLHYLDGVPLQDLAALFNCTPSRVSQLHVRALELMRQAAVSSDSRREAA